AERLKTEQAKQDAERARQEQVRLAEEARVRAEEEARRRADADRQRAEAEKAAVEARRRAEQERKNREAEDARIMAELEAEQQAAVTRKAEFTALFRKTNKNWGTSPTAVALLAELIAKAIQEKWDSAKVESAARSMPSARVFWANR